MWTDCVCWWIPVILLSGHATDEVRIEGFEVGADGYLSKPFTVRELRARIRATLDDTKLRVTTARAQTLAEAETRAGRERATILESITEAFYALDAQWRWDGLHAMPCLFGSGPHLLPSRDRTHTDTWALTRLVRLITVHSFV